MTGKEGVFRNLIVIHVNYLLYMLIPDPKTQIKVKDEKTPSILTWVY